MNRVIRSPEQRLVVLGQAIRARRMALRLRQKDLAAATEMSPPKICRIERGQERVRLADLEAIARALKQDVKSLLAIPVTAKNKNGGRGARQ